MKCCYDLKYIINHYHAMKSKTAQKQFIYLTLHVIACMYCLDTQYNVLPFCITELKYITLHEIQGQTFCLILLKK